MKYGSVCSGIEAATVAWDPLGWSPAFFSDIEAFPRALLRHHYPDVPLHGRDQRKGEDFSSYADECGFQTIGADEYDPIDLLVGGTPCQSFSIAGKRGGMADGRGNLALEYIRLAHRKRARWVVWENVPGVFSSNGGEDFRCFLSGLVRWSVPIPEDGWANSGVIAAGPVDGAYGVAWRVLDAQYFGVAQRRRRVFVVGHLGDWRRAAAVLLERESLSGHPAPRREKGQGTAADVAPSLVSSGRGVERTGETRGQDPVVAVSVSRMVAFGEYDDDGTASALKARDYKDATDLVAFAQDVADPITANEQKTYTHEGENNFRTRNVVAIQERAICENLEAGPDGVGVRDDDTAYTIEARSVPQAVSDASAVRRLTPRECERLQGFPDDYTLVPFRGKPASDGPRYKALGNSMAVPCMLWLGQRIQMVEDLGL